MRTHVFGTPRILLYGVAAAAILISVSAPAKAGYIQDNLVSDIPGLATFTDPDLVNPWGFAHSSTSPWWVSDNGTARATLYDGTGAKRSLVVAIPGTNAAPTGMVSNSTSSFTVSGTAARFI